MTSRDRVRLLRLINAPIDEPPGSRQYEKRVLHRRIIMHYEFGGENRHAVAAMLGLSLRQFHRERRVAIDWVNECLAGAAPPSETVAEIDEIEALVLARLAPTLDYADARRRFATLMACRLEPVLRARAHLALYEFLGSRDDREAVHRERPALHASIARIADARARSEIESRSDLVDAHIAWRDGAYGEALVAADRAGDVARPLADAGIRDCAETLCTALQLRAQLRWETGGAADALSALNGAEAIIRRHRLETLPCAVTNGVGRSDVNVEEAIAVASSAFDRAALYGDAEDAAGALLIIAMARGGQRRFSAAVEHVSYALEFADDIAAVGRTRLLAHAAEVLIICGRRNAAKRVLDRARSLVPAGTIADAQRRLRAALFAEVSGEPVRALAIANDAIGDLERARASRFLGPGLKIRARIRAAVGDRDGALADLECAVGRLAGESYAWTYAEALAMFGRATKNRSMVREAAVLTAAFGGA